MYGNFYAQDSSEPKDDKISLADFSSGEIKVLPDASVEELQKIFD